VNLTGLDPRRGSSGWVTAGRKEHDEAALDVIDEMAAGVRAVPAPAGGAVARGPAHQRATRQQQVTGGATLGRNLHHGAIRKLFRTHVRASHVLGSRAIDRWTWSAERRGSSSEPAHTPE
jgi:hypothetical protein